MNTFIYVGGNPDRWVDPTGRFWQAAAIVVGSGYAYYQGYQAGVLLKQNQCATMRKFTEREGNPNWTPAQDRAKETERMMNNVRAYGEIGVNAAVAIGLAGAGGAWGGAAIAGAAGLAGVKAGFDSCGCS